MNYETIEPELLPLIEEARKHGNVEVTQIIDGKKTTIVIRKKIGNILTHKTDGTTTNL